MLLALAIGATLLVAPPAADAEDGVTLRQFVADRPHCAVSTGIAFDGSRLYLSCWDSTDLYVVSPEDGRRLDTINVSGMNGIGALAWDRSRGQMWACDSRTQSVVLLTINGSSASAQTRFKPSGGCIDGLAYDGGDDTLFTSGDVASTVYHYSADGDLLDSRYVRNSLGGCGNSGIAIGGGDLFLANNGCSAIYRAQNQQDAIPRFFASYPRRIEDLECDDITFREQGKAAIWAQDAYDAEINAFELNIGDCGFGGLPPSDDQFVYVALGDSYQSGEGAGNSIADTDRYLSAAYENGSNYPAQVGPEQDTYTQPFGGNSCHRALANYAKINRDRLDPGADTVLVDMTCSGAQIEPAGQPAIVGRVGGQVAADSQVRQALNRLEAEGIDAGDVDLVTVGMGGNDAGFGKIVMACVLPGLLERVLDEYPDAPGELQFAINAFGSCANAERLIGDLDPAIAALQPKEEWAQQELLGAFPTARVLQLNYPDILPSGDRIPEWCGGIRRGDVEFARDKITRIDAAIGDSIAASGDARLELVDIEDRFGPRALCSGNPALKLANGISESNVDAEVERLLDLDGDGDPIARARLDALAAEYREYRACLGNELNPFDGDCDRTAEWQDVMDAFDDLLQYLQGEQTTIIANVVQPPGTEPEEVRFDRSRGLFHPNARGFEVMACHVRAGYADASAGDCLASPNAAPDSVNGNPFSLFPIPQSSGDLLSLLLSGFAANSPIRITFYSQEVGLGEFTADADGVVRADVVVPDVAPGVHRLQVAGLGADGSQIVKEIRVELPGEPVPGQDFGVYLCCFQDGNPDDGVTELVDVSYLGATFTTVPDAEGGILLELPVPGAGAGAGVEAISQLTGERVTQTVVEEPRFVVEQFGAGLVAPPGYGDIRAGRTVPVEFRVVDAQGVPVGDPAVISLLTGDIACQDPDTLADEATAGDAGRSDLRYKRDGWWQYNWQTDRGWSGTCRTFTVALEDGGSHHLWFRLD